MEMRVHVVTLGVKDLEKSKNFYESLGWVNSELSNSHITFFQTGGLIFGLFPASELAKDASVPLFNQERAPFSLAQVLPSKEAVDVLIQEAINAGAKLIKKPEEVFWGGYSGYFADPDGFLWEIAYIPFVIQKLVLGNAKAFEICRSQASQY